MSSVMTARELVGMADELKSEQRKWLGIEEWLSGSDVERYAAEKLREALRASRRKRGKRINPKKPKGKR